MRFNLISLDPVIHFDRQPPTMKLGDYYVRELERVGTDRRQSVRYLVVGTGRVEQIPRSRWEKQVRPA
jgi:hypothetical protein